MNKQDIYDFLNVKKIEFEVTEHIPVYTMDDMLRVKFPYPDIVAKNLFLKDNKKNYYLITVKGERTINLKKFQTLFGTKRLSFATEHELVTILGLNKGCVTPFGLLNDEKRIVKFFIGNELKDGKIGIHPNVNAATVWIKVEDLLQLIREHGNPFYYF